MQPARAISDGAGDVAARIGPEIPAQDIEALRRAWLAHRVSKKPRSAHEYAAVVRGVLLDIGAAEPRDLTFERLSAFFAGKVARREWSGATHNRNLSAVRSFVRYLQALGHLADDPLALFERADREDGPGARAATVDEARAMVRHARACELADRRCKGHRALYWASMFLSGARYGEPARWLWRGMLLDDPVPSIAWEVGWHKAKRAEPVPMHPELARLMRLHRDGAAHAKPDAPVFERAPNDATFEQDRRRAGIAKEDARGRSFSGHSARKFVSTELRRAGVDSALIDRILRHATGVPGRYDDRTQAETAAALALLPGVWPWELENERPRNSRAICLDPGGRTPESVSGRSTHDQQHHSSAEPPARHSASGERPIPSGGGARGSTELARESAGGTGAGAPGVEGVKMRSEMPISALITDADSTADLLEAIARFLRESRRAGDERAS